MWVRWWVGLRDICRSPAPSTFLELVGLLACFFANFLSLQHPSFFYRDVFAMTLGIFEPKTKERPPGTELLVDDDEARQGGLQDELGSERGTGRLKHGKGKVSGSLQASPNWWNKPGFDRKARRRVRLYLSRNHLTIQMIRS